MVESPSVRARPWPASKYMLRMQKRDSRVAAASLQLNAPKQQMTERTKIFSHHHAMEWAFFGVTQLS